MRNLPLQYWCLLHFPLVGGLLGDWIVQAVFICIGKGLIANGLLLWLSAHAIVVVAMTGWGLVLDLLLAIWRNRMMRVWVSQGLHDSRGIFPLELIYLWQLLLHLPGSQVIILRRGSRLFLGAFGLLNPFKRISVLAWLRLVQSRLTAIVNLLVLVPLSLVLKTSQHLYLLLELIHFLDQLLFLGFWLLIWLLWHVWSLLRLVYFLLSLVPFISFSLLLLLVALKCVLKWLEVVELLKLFS